MKTQTPSQVTNGCASTKQKSWTADCDVRFLLSMIRRPRQPLQPMRHGTGPYRRAVQIIARLAMWRQVHGRFPEQLSSVLEVEGFTKSSPESLWDPFANTELAYSSSGEGFVLYSVGPNMQKDESASDDHVWRWPGIE